MSKATKGKGCVLGLLPPLRKAKLNLAPKVHHRSFPKNKHRQKKSSKLTVFGTFGPFGTVWDLPPHPPQGYFSRVPPGDLPVLPVQDRIRWLAMVTKLQSHVPMPDMSQPCIRDQR